MRDEGLKKQLFLLLSLKKCMISLIIWLKKCSFVADIH